ncbi:MULTISPECIES: PEP-utilizing enzyme [Streptomyces]|uniref:PEP-utilizing enzyme n=1 Tax=Streptomyces TaxID=1883 RepID=UPI0016755124|nr:MULTISPECIES: PEP-utilizing enzyme [Streptomyces]MBD3578828.1 hypothetical protein [Streptomyces sp. KD18]GGS80332.1 pyruvate, phosphate dikinase [Streptomyces toxytricini]
MDHESTMLPVAFNGADDTGKTTQVGPPARRTGPAAAPAGALHDHDSSAKDATTGFPSAKQVAVILPRPAGTAGPWSDNDRLASVLTELVGTRVTVVELQDTDTDADLRSLPDRTAFASVLWCQLRALPAAECSGALLDDQGIRVWTGKEADEVVAYSFGHLALRAHAACIVNCPPRAKATMIETVRHLIEEHHVPFHGREHGLVPLTDGDQRARLLLGGKDVSLRRLAPVLPELHVDRGHTLTWTAWQDNRAAALRDIRRVYGTSPVIVRSCAVAEDSWERSAAGEYDSVPVTGGGDTLLAQAITKVFASYPAPDAANKVLVQRFLQPVLAAAVVTTRTVSGAPYYVAALDSTSGRTDMVTSGTGDHVDTWYVHRDSLERVLENPSAHGLPDFAARVLGAAAQTEDAAGTNRLDTELAITEDGVHLLQVRPLAAGRGRTTDDAQITAILSAARRTVEDMSISDNRLLGDRPALSCMADWNPAEMLGRRPRPLSISLYRHFITDLSWARQRKEYGYRDLRGVPLMHTLAGHPYIDVRASLASFLPAGLGEKQAREVLQAQIARLSQDPDSHDKIEFEIAATCWTPDLSQRTSYLTQSGVGQTTLDNLHDHLLRITRTGIGRLTGDMNDLARLGLPTEKDTHPSRLEATLERTRRAGQVFAHLARAGFVAVDLLRSLRGAGQADRYDDWMRGLGTVTTRMQRDAAEVAAGRLSWETFVDRNRWVRPGTYDLTVPSYGQDPEGYLRPLLDQHYHVEPLCGAPWSPDLSDQVSGVLEPLGIDADGAEDFFRKAITAREHGKAVYAAWVSASLESIAALGGTAGLSRDDITHLTIADLLTTPSDTWPATVLRRRAIGAAEAQVELPEVITDTGDLHCFRRGSGRTNFIGTGRVDGRVHAAPAPASPPEPGSIIVIESADPGYDWIFAHRPGALVTAYGGANSHMAIRCAELGIPAAIGAGPQSHAACAVADRLVVDCDARRLEVIR